MIQTVTIAYVEVCGRLIKAEKAIYITADSIARIRELLVWEAHRFNDRVLFVTHTL